MSKAFIAIALVIAAASVGVPAFYAQEDNGGAEKPKPAKEIKCLRYIVELEGLTEENSSDVEKALGSIEAVASAKAMPLKCKAMVTVKADHALTEDAATEALKAVDGVAFKSMKELKGPSAVSGHPKAPKIKSLK